MIQLEYLVDNDSIRLLGKKDFAKQGVRKLFNELPDDLIEYIEMQAESISCRRRYWNCN